MIGRSERHIPHESFGRPLRFLCTGAFAALVQLSILDAFTEQHWTPIAANAVALLLSTQVNFVLSYVFTWGDRRPLQATPRAVLGRWTVYQGSTAGAALLNMGVFILTRADLGTLVASALGTAVAALLNYVAGNRLVFQPRGASPFEPSRHAARGADPHNARETVA